MQGAPPGERPAADQPLAQRSRQRTPHADARPTATPGAREPENGGGLTPLASRSRPRTPGREPGQRAAAGEQPPSYAERDDSPGVSRRAVAAVGSSAEEGLRCFWPRVRVRRAGPAPVALSRGSSPRRVGLGGWQCPARCAPGTRDGRESQPSGKPALSPEEAPLSTTASSGAVFARATSSPGSERRLRAVESGDVSFLVF